MNNHPRDHDPLDTSRNKIPACLKVCIPNNGSAMNYSFKCQPGLFVVRTYLAGASVGSTQFISAADIRPTASVTAGGRSMIVKSKREEG